jgi:hypothetical protein
MSLDSKSAHDEFNARLEMLQYTCYNQMIAPNLESVNTTGNGIRYTSEWWMLLNDRNWARMSDLNTFMYAIQSAKVQDGLYRRAPWSTDHESWDDYATLAAASVGHAQDILRYGKRHWYVYNWIQPGKFRLGQWLGRFRPFVAHLHWAALEQPNFIDRLIWSVAVAMGGMKEGGDTWIMTWHKIRTWERAGRHGLMEKIAVKIFDNRKKRLHSDGIAKFFHNPVLQKYYGI